MGMDVDPAGSDQQPDRIELAAPRPRLAADCSDPSAFDRDVTGESRLAGPVDDRAAANDDVVHGLVLA
jgi:hypothetical protein